MPKGTRVSSEMLYLNGYTTYPFLRIEAERGKRVVWVTRKSKYGTQCMVSTKQYLDRLWKNNQER